MKFSLPFVPAIIAIALTLNACTTLANRRDLYSPEKPHGPYTDKWHARMISDTVTKTPRVYAH